MDTTKIDASRVTRSNAWHIGHPNAPVKVIEFINFRCPYCKQWWDKANEVLTPYVEDEKVERIVKHYDKPKESLQKGNVVRQYLSYDDPAEVTKGLIDQIFSSQEEWGELEQEKIPNWLMKNLSLVKIDNEETSQNVIDEAQAANIELVPTVFIEDNIFDENISNKELKQLVEDNLNN